MQNLAIYIHYPFCKAKCPYCDFNSHVRAGVDDAAWLKSYLTELTYFRELTGQRNIASIFFGGGTPSLMPPQTVAEIINFIAKNWQLDKNAEITLEANPTSVEYLKFKNFREAGVNRVSIGVQSFNEAELKFLGRQHNSEEARTAINFAVEIFPRYSFDLIYALPEQSLLAWEKDLTTAIALTNGHISLYQLTIEENTLFQNLYKKGAFQMPVNDTAAEFYELTQQICESHNLPAYEISNHASPGNESLHNLAYWNYDEYIGIGPGAHGRVSGYASVMTRSPEKWLAAVEEKSHGLEKWVELSEQEKFEEKLMMGLRLKSGVELDFTKLNNLELLMKQNFIETTQTHIKCTKSGLLMLNSVLGALL